MASTRTKEAIIANWRAWFRNNRYDAEYQEALVLEFIGKATNESDMAVAEEMQEEYEECCRRNIDLGKKACPIGFFKPSWEQAQFLNGWHPDFEPEIAPEGYRSLCNFSANRVGKTCAIIIFVLLWLLPNDPDWVMFEEHEDPPLYNPDGSILRPSRGKYTVRPRPDWELWKRTGRLIAAPVDEPPMRGPFDVWHGVEDDNHWKEKVCGSPGGQNGYMAWIPKDAIARRSDGGTAIYIQDRRFDTRWGHKVMGKTYNSDAQAWAGHAVRIVAMDEGFEKDKLTEATLRVQSGGYFLWAYTPTEARNIGRRSAIAHGCYNGKHLLVGKARFWIDQKMEDAPEQVMPADKKRDDMARLSAEGDEGRARMNGGFFESSPRVFSNFKRAAHVLPWNGTEIMAAIRGDGPDGIVSKFHRANVIRGMDEGTAHPTTCAWVAILRTGEYVLFREFSQSGLSVTDRCEQIISLSRNVREISNPHPEEDRRRYVERVPEGGMKIRRTFADSKIFRRNPETAADDWTETYARRGLRLERAGNIGPAARCDYVNDMLRGDQSRLHLVTGERPGHRLYVAADCLKMIERLENYLQEQYATGPNAGQFTGKPEKFGDDETDALCYACISKLRWMDDAQVIGDSISTVNHLTGYVQ